MISLLLVLGTLSVIAASRTIAAHAPARVGPDRSHARSAESVDHLRELLHCRLNTLGSYDDEWRHRPLNR